MSEGGIFICSPVPTLAVLPFVVVSLNRDELYGTP